jgi:integrase
MTRALHRLSARRIHTTKPTGLITRGPNKGKPRKDMMLCDGGGLYPQITLGEDGDIRRSGIFRYQLSKDHPVRDMGLGRFGDTLAEVAKNLEKMREQCEEYRRLIRDGRDPIRERDAKRARNLAESAAVLTFDKAAATYIAQHRAGWGNPIHAAQWVQTIEQYVSPVIGKMSVTDIDTPHVLKVLTPIWQEKPVTAKRIRGRIESILGWATVSGYRKDATGHDKPNPARWRSHLQTMLPAPGKVKAVKPQPSLPFIGMPAFVADVRACKGVAPLALEFAALCPVRVSDVVAVEWSHISRAERRWDIPKFSKTGQPFRMPLSDAAIAVLDKAEKLAGEIGGAVGASKYVFPNDVTGAALKRNALLDVVRRVGRKGTMSVHGCRAAFRTWAQEATNFPWELCELSLGHRVGDAVERSYARGDGYQKRVAIMQRWANFLAKPAITGKTVNLALA